MAIPRVCSHGQYYPVAWWRNGTRRTHPVSSGSDSETFRDEQEEGYLVSI